MPESEAEKKSFVAGTKLPQFLAMKYWQDTYAEIKLKRALEKMMVRLKILTLLIPSVNLSRIRLKCQMNHLASDW